MLLTYLGHSCFTLQLENKTILFDPFISNNPLAKDINIQDIKCDYILQSHGHEDHLADLMPIAQNNNANIFCSWEIHSWLNKQNYLHTHPMNIGGTKTFEWGSIKMVYAAHSSSLPDGTYAGVSAGWIIESAGKRIYYSGDTALTYDMKLIGEFWKPDVAILCIGDNFTMNYKDAAIAADFIQCNHIIGMHNDTFGFIQIDQQEAIQYFKQKEKSLLLMKIGEGLHI